jgi:Replication initiation factor
MIAIKQKLKKPDATYNNYNYPIKGIGLLNNNLESKKTTFVIDEKIGQKTSYFKITFIGNPLPKIDKLTFTYPIKNIESQSHIRDFCKGMNNNKKLDHLYQYNYWLKINDSIIRLSFKPHSKENNFLRIDYNPFKLKGNEKELEELLNQLIPDGLDKEKIKVTRLDIALDYPLICPRHIMVKGNQYKVSQNYCDGVGTIETHYVGSHKSKVQYVIYDKTQEQKGKGKATQHQTTRIEIRLRNVSLTELKETNPFVNLQVFHIPRPIGVKDYVWAFFLSYAQTYGLQAALRKIPKQDIQKFIARLKEIMCQWWNPKQLVDNYTKQIQQISLFDSNK